MRWASIQTANRHSRLKGRGMRNNLTLGLCLLLAACSPPKPVPAAVASTAFIACPYAECTDKRIGPTSRQLSALTWCVDLQFKYKGGDVGAAVNVVRVGDGWGVHEITMNADCNYYK